MQRAGFHVLAAIDCDSKAIATLETNLVEFCPEELDPVVHALQEDLTKYDPADLAERIGTREIDAIVGGPPCQGFSTARQVDGSNHGKRLKDDPRRYLYRDFLRFVAYFQPKIFVLENVLGMRSASGGEYFTRVQKEARALGRADGRSGYRVHSQIEDAWKLGVPQKRRRQLIIGVRNDLAGYFMPELKPAPRTVPHIWLGPAICDLPTVRAGGGSNEMNYDLRRRKQHLRKWGKSAKRYLYDVLEVSQVGELTNHVARPHSDRDLRDFKRLKEGESSAVAMRERGVQFEFPYDKSSFKDRYTRQSRVKPCSTIVAHLSKDGLMFIHPTQNRSITPREAARVQSFPDWYRFPDARTHAFRLIGNAVPPLVGESVGLAVQQFLKNAEVNGPPTAGRETSHEFHEVPSAKSLRRKRIRLPVDQDEAMRRLQQIAGMDDTELRRLSTDDFLQAWHSLLYLLPGLHPDNALDHGTEVEHLAVPEHYSEEIHILISKCYARSGWPLSLEFIGREAWRRFELNEIAEGEFYCNEAQRAGLLWFLSSGKQVEKAGAR